ncbi:hypothetical protein [Nocardia sp. CC216A]|uniref:hypothetical protein n=1 Tax=Nocardia sp. CC216A TaxID=3044158 RepID=UPI0027956C4D|nr:hypothetical protein [Nocardia sp. CC216A]
MTVVVALCAGVRPETMAVALCAGVRPVTVVVALCAGAVVIPRWPVARVVRPAGTHGDPPVNPGAKAWGAGRSRGAAGRSRGAAGRSRGAAGRCRGAVCRRQAVVERARGAGYGAPDVKGRRGPAMFLSP